MRSLALCYLAGLAAALACRPWPLPLVVALAVAGAIAALYRPRLRALAVASIGLAWGMHATTAALAERLPLARDGEVAALGARVAEFPRSEYGTLLLVLDRVQARGTTGALPARVQVAWHHAPQVPALGAWCELRVRLTRPRGLANPGGRDRERERLTRHLGATGRVLTHPANLCLDLAPPASLAGARAAISRAIDAAVAAPPASAVLRALAVDDRSGLSKTQWEVMQRTGTSHLLSISGLHVSIVALGAGAVVRWLAAVVGVRRQRYPAVRAGGLAALAAALGYAALAGFGIPVQRASLMVAVAVAAALSGRRVLGWDNWLLALVMLATLDPLCLLANGLWLSFTAVAVLIALASGGPRRRSGLAVAWRTHLAMSVALAPLTAFLFGAVPLAAPLANFVAVPAGSLLIVPLTLLGVLVAPWSDAASALAWDLAARLWELLWRFLVLLAEGLPAAAAPGLVGTVDALLVSAALVLLWLPRALPVRALALLLLASLALPRQTPLAAGEFRLHLFDVGQGLAALIETRAAALLYDTGPRWWPRGDDAGHRVVVPALAALRVRRLARVLVSHGDLDHAGGLASLLGAVPVAEVLSAAPVAGAARVPVRACQAPLAWHWSGVEFEVLGPATGAVGSDNDRSCVLAVRGRYGRLLLPGDIEASAEARLVAQVGTALAADVLVAPHHGSRTSSSASFVAAVAPRIVLIPAGWRNRYGFPHAVVLARYAAAGARVLRSADHGAVSVSFTARGLGVARARARGLGFWR